MSRICKWFPAMSALAALALSVASRDAHATLILEGTITPTVATTYNATPYAAGTVYTVYATDNNVSYPGGTPTGVGGGPVVMLTDTDGASGNLSLAPGTLFTSASGSYTVSTSSNVEMQAFNANSLFSNALQITNTTGDSVATSLAVGDNNFVGPALVASGSVSATFQNATGTTYSGGWYDDPANAQPMYGASTGGVTGIPGNLLDTYSFTSVTGNDSFAQNLGPAGVNDTGNFGMSLNFNFTLVNGGTFVSRGQNELKTAVPEPGTLAMAFLAAPLLGLAYRRHRRAQTR